MTQAICERIGQKWNRLDEHSSLCVLTDKFPFNDLKYHRDLKTSLKKRKKM